MDSSALTSWIGPIITAIVMYIKTQGAQKAGDKAAEIVGEKATEMTLNTGQKALSLLRSKFFAKSDAKALCILENVEKDPDDEDYQQKLVKETARLASADPSFVRELKVLAERVTIVQSGSVIIDNKAPSYGAQGVFNAPVQFDNRSMKDPL